MTTQDEHTYSDTAPNYTVYINNLNEKIKVPELKKQLYGLLSQYGPILDVIAGRSMKMKGQAWVVFQDVNHATMAKRKLDGFDFNGKPMRVDFAKSKSDAIAKLDKTYMQQKQQRDELRRKREEDDDERPNKRQNTGKRTRPKPQKLKITAPITSAVNEPNKILFLEGLAEDIHEQPHLVEMLFQNYPGYKEVRLIPGKGIGFVEYDSEFNAATAMTALQGFKVQKASMQITFAKK